MLFLWYKLPMLYFNDLFAISGYVFGALAYKYTLLYLKLSVTKVDLLTTFFYKYSVVFKLSRLWHYMLLSIEFYAILTAL